MIDEIGYKLELVRSIIGDALFKRNIDERKECIELALKILNQINKEVSNG